LFNEGVFELTPNNLPSDKIYAHARSYRIGETILGEYALSGNIIRRSLAQHSAGREEMLVLRLHRSGSTKGTMDGKDFRMRPDRLTLFDFNQPIHADTAHVDYISFMAPYSLVGFDPSVHPRFLQISLSTPVGRMLQSNLELMVTQVPTASVEQATALSDGMCALLQSLVIKDLPRESMQNRLVHAREIAVRRYIEVNLKSPALDADDICRSVGLSRTVLYRMFAEKGGVRRAITNLRLERVRKDLATSEPTRGVIGKVARHWGFRDQAHFTKLFRKTTGLVPGDVIGTDLVMSSGPKISDVFAERKRHFGVKPLIELYR